MTAPSASKLIPPNPESVSIIRAITPNITTISAPFSRFGLLRIGSRGTIVRMTSGSLAIFSPPSLTPSIHATLLSLGGPVSYITAPDIEHHIFLSEWTRAFPSAKVIAVEGLAEKREKDAATRGTKFTHIFTRENKREMRIDEDFDRDFEYEYVDAHPNGEFVVCYKPEGTLIEADLIWNLPAGEQYSRCGESATEGVLTRFFVGMLGLQGEAMAQKRLLWYGFSRGDRKGFGESMRRIRGWDFDRIIPCHGDVVETGGKGVFERVMEWHLKAEK